jgi:hypothetical protein
MTEKKKMIAGTITMGATLVKTQACKIYYIDWT